MYRGDFSEEQLNYVKKLFKKRRELCSNTKLAYSVEERILALRLLDIGYSREKIAEELEIAFPTISSWYLRKKEGLLAAESPKPRCLQIIESNTEGKHSNKICEKQSDICEISFCDSISIRLPVSAVNSYLLKEIRKAATSC